MTRHRRQFALACLALCLAGMPAWAITLQLDYTYDSNSFFPVGSQARTALDAAASYFSGILNDTFSAIQTPAPLVKPNGTNVTWQWSLNFNNPTTNANVVLNNPTIPADQFRIYAGARNLTAPTLGIGGPGGYSWGVSGSVHPSDQTQVNQTTAAFEDAVENRGESSGFARWGGAITFDSSPQNAWHFNHTTTPPADTTDFYSVAIHELAHALGFGSDDTDPGNVTPWESHVSGSSFFGSNATAAYGGPVPLNPTEAGGGPDLSHWAINTNSVVFGGATAQETAMDPDFTSGTYKNFTALDAAAMKDIGWTVLTPSPPPPRTPGGVFGDYNNNGIVDAADYVIWRRRNNQSFTIPNDETPGTVNSGDYTVWQKNFGKTPGAGAGSGGSAVPEPGVATLVWFGCCAMGLARRKRRG